ncbi:MAG: DUF992 domain-containing protein [Pseudomonadota bacterium]
MTFPRFALATVFVSLLAVAPATAQNRVKAGTLDCNVAGGIGLIIGSQKSVSCSFVNNRGRREIYAGQITKFGLDLGITGTQRLLWAVYAPTGYLPYALEGRYGGGQAEASVGVGVGANVLVGGNSDTISLQPLSVSAQTGINIAAGVAGLELHPAQTRYRR